MGLWFPNLLTEEASSPADWRFKLLPRNWRNNHLDHPSGPQTEGKQLPCVSLWRPRVLSLFLFAMECSLQKQFLQEENQPSEMVEGEKNVPVRYGVHSFVLLKRSIILWSTEERGEGKCMLLQIHPEHKLLYIGIPGRPQRKETIREDH